jgi:putative spermidine/putrescine transport system substrate-binding protein
MAITRRRLIKASASLATLASLGRVLPALGQSGDLVVTTYGGRWERFWRESVLPAFAQETGVKPVLDVGIASTWTANLRASGPQKPAYSVVMMNEFLGALLRAEGFFEPWQKDKIPNLQSIHPAARLPGDNGVTALFSPIGIAYRTDLVKSRPASWKDFWNKPEMRGKVGLFGITNTAGYMFLMTVSKVYGKGPLDFDTGLGMISKLKPFPQGNLSGALSALLTRGEIVACPLDAAETINLKQKGAPVDFAVPAEGMFMFDQTLSLLKNGTNRDASHRYLNFLLGEEMQTKLATEFFLVPTNTRVKLPPELAKQFPVTVADIGKVLQFDWLAANAQRDKVTEQWNRMMI